MYGEKFLEKKIKGNKIIRISEYKEFNYNYLELIENLNDLVTDDWEAQLDHNIFMDRNEDFDSFEVDSVLEWVEEIIVEKREDEEDEGDIVWLTDWIKPLQEAKGFTIHLQHKEKIILPGDQDV